jgi:hypothetical protein
LLPVKYHKAFININQNEKNNIEKERSRAKDFLYFLLNIHDYPFDRINLKSFQLSKKDNIVSNDLT